MMETKPQQTQPQPVQAPAQPTATTQPVSAAPQSFYASANGHGISLHEKYLQTSEEFNRALAAMSQVEQELLRLGMHNGNHAHLEIVLKRMARLMDHQEALLAMHASLLQGQPASIPVSTPAPANPQSILADYVVVQTPVSVPVPAAIAVNEPEPAVKITLPAVDTVSVQAAQPEPVLPQVNDVVGQDIAGMLLTVVAEKTGYPADTISLDMNMEADLGIDSIKRVEILGAMQENLQGVDGAAMNMESLSNLGTLQEVVDFLSQMAGVLEKNA